MRLDRDSKKWLTDLCGAAVRFAEPMAAHTSLQVGGPADAFVRPASIDVLTALIEGARRRNLPYLIVGDGTNLLVGDGGIRGIVVVLSQCLTIIGRAPGTADAVRVTAQAGAKLQRLCQFALKHGLAGLNFALGIPGTVGGGIRMNAGTRHGWMGDVLDAIEVLGPGGDIRSIDRSDLRIAYRRMNWSAAEGPNRHRSPIILGGCFRLQPGDPGPLRHEARAILKERRRHQPSGLPSAGCFFKNPPVGEPAGRLIELAGLKNKKIGGAQISERHANFIVNTGRASAADILRLMTHVQASVLERFNVQLEPEVEIVGE